MGPTEYSDTDEIFEQLLGLVKYALTSYLLSQPALFYILAMTAIPESKREARILSV